jgi:Spy/CpxP family protein refolding chaperone
MDTGKCVNHEDRPGKLRNMSFLCNECRDNLDTERDRLRAAREQRMEAKKRMTLKQRYDYIRMYGAESEEDLRIKYEIEQGCFLPYFT